MPGSEQNGRYLLGIFTSSFLVFSGSAGQELFAFSFLCDGVILLGFLSLSLLLTFVPLTLIHHFSSFPHVCAW
jgi:hypothetical protein